MKIKFDISLRQFFTPFLLLTSIFSPLALANKDKATESNDSVEIVLKVDQPQEFIYGWQLMSKQEQIDYKQNRSLLTTSKDRHLYDIQHQVKMQERAKAIGITLTEEPQTEKVDQDE